MKVTGVICEYNPLHGGHIAQLKKIRENTEADYIIALMSGDFVQRGEPAIFDMAARAKAALLAGADLVIELPVIFSTASATDFAAAGVALLDKLGVVTDLCFGSECGDISLLCAAAGILADEPDAFKETLRYSLKCGDTYPKAQAKALAAVLKDDGVNSDSDAISDIFSSPNNILGTEYIKALIARSSRIRPFTFKREGQSYNDSSSDYLNSGNHPSASAIRRAIKEDDFDYSAYLRGVLSDSYHMDVLYQDRKLCDTMTDGRDISDILPAAVPVYADDLSILLNEKLLEFSSDTSEDGPVRKLSAISGMTPQLAARLSHQIFNFESFTGRAASLKSKSCTYARVSRALLHIVLGITDDDVSLAKKNDYITYARIIGFRREAKSLLGGIHKSSSLPLITKTAGAGEVLSTDGFMSFSKDLFASHLYQSLVYARSGAVPPNEYTRPLIIV